MPSRKSARARVLAAWRQGLRAGSLIAAALGLLVLPAGPVALAAAPSNDDFDNATVVSSLRFTDTLSTIEATAAPDDPSTCFTTAYSVWYSFTPAVTTDDYTDLGAGGFHVAVFSGARGSLTQIGCGQDVVPWRAEAGITYHIMVAGSASDLIFSLNQAFPAGNDDFDNATVISAVPFSDSIPSQNVRDSTLASDDPDCYGAGWTVWYSLTTTSTIGIEANTAGSSYNTTLCVYVGARGNLTRVAANDNASTEPTFVPTSKVRFLAESSFTYHIMVGSKFCCGGDLALSVTQSTVPSNDSFSSPTVISSVPFVDHVDTRTATASFDDPSVPECFGGLYTVWYTFTPTVSMPIAADTVGSSYTTVVGVFTGSRGALTTVTCEPGIYEPDKQARVTFTAEAGVTYYLMVGSYYLEAGDLTVNINPALDLQIAIDSTGYVTTSGGAVVSGTIACSLDVSVDVHGTVFQDAKPTQESGVIWVTGFGCSSPVTPWSAMVVPNNRRYRVGSATVSVQVSGCGPHNCDYVTQEADVTLRRR